MNAKKPSLFAILAIGVPMVLIIIMMLMLNSDLIGGNQPVAESAMQVQQDIIFEGDCYAPSGFDLLPGGLVHVVCYGPEIEPTPTLTPTTEPTATRTPQATRTPTPEPTITSTATIEPPTPTVEPTATDTPPPPVAHDTTTWHPAGGEENGYMHHGVSWDETSPGMQAFLQSLVDQGILTHWNAIGNQWMTSDSENVYPCEEGTNKHCGFVNLYIPDTGCANERNRTDGLCIKEAFMAQHANPTMEEARARRHSQWVAALVCDRETQTQCDYVFSGGRPDYVVMHNGYKDAVCDQATNPPGYPLDMFNPPYSTGHQNSGDLIRFDLNPHYWNSKTPAISRQFAGNANAVIQAEWSELNSFEYQHIDHCAEPEFDIALCPDGTCDYDATRFQWFSLFLGDEQFSPLPGERPYFQYHDADGIFSPTCFELTTNCIPLIVGAGVPAGEYAFFEHLVQQGGLNGPQFDFGPGAPVGLFRMPGYSN